MRKVTLFVSVSLDGFFKGPKKAIDWHMVDDEFHAHANEVLKAAGGFLSGRVTYELMAGFWPTADADPASTPRVKEFARIWRDIPKVVYSRTLTSAGWNTTIAREVVRGEVEGLKARARGDLVVGGGDLGAAFMRQDLIDEYRIYVHPIQINRGGEASFSPLEGEGPPAPRRDPDLRERGRPSPVRASPTRWGELEASATKPSTPTWCAPSTASTRFWCSSDRRRRQTFSPRASYGPGGQSHVRWGNRA
jgi:dihydrofolate reductase